MENERQHIWQNIRQIIRQNIRYSTRHHIFKHDYIFEHESY